jgi:hypothetical protein
MVRGVKKADVCTKLAQNSASQVAAMTYFDGDQSFGVMQPSVLTAKTRSTAAKDERPLDDADATFRLGKPQSTNDSFDTARGTAIIQTTR